MKKRRVFSFSSVSACLSLSHCWTEVVFQKHVLEFEVLLHALTPPSFVIEVHISPLFELIVRGLGLFVSLKPGHILGVEAPAVLTELSRSHVLLIGPLLHVEGEE